jgi:uncharacterized protein
MPGRRIDIAAVALAMVLVWPAHSFAGAYEDGWEAFRRNDYQTAYSIWRPIAAHDPRAQALLAEMYLGGLGVPQNRELALHYAVKAADRGVARAQYLLGSMYRDGKGVEKDFAKAIALFRKAAEQDYAWAQFDLGLIYYVGEGAPLDLVEAYRWIGLAATPRPDDGMNTEIPASVLLDELGAKLTPDQLKEAQERMRQWRAARIH